MIDKTPLISVIMPVLNGEKYLKQAIESVLNQTFTDFELIVVDDGSTDQTPEILRAYAESDDRVRIVTNPENKGIGYSRNRGVATSRGEYIANLDADDWSMPERFDKQVNFLNQHPEISVLGTACHIVDENGVQQKTVTYPSSSGMIRWSMIFSSPFCNPSVMIRKKIFDDPSIRYEECVPPAEDYMFWSVVVQNYKMANLKDALTYYRWHKTNSSTTQNSAQWLYSLDVTRKQIKIYTENELTRSLIEEVRKPEKIQSVPDARVVLKTYKKLLKATKSWELTDEESINIKKNAIRRVKLTWQTTKRSPKLLLDLLYFQLIQIQIFFLSTIKRIFRFVKSET